MLHSMLLNLILFWCLTGVSKSGGDEANESGDDLGGNLVSSLRNDANLDLSVDEEYEDLRAELLAYHSALASLTSSRRSLINTPCWILGGICVNYQLCTGFRYLTEVPGCKDKLNVCCFAWNRYKVRDMRDKGIGNLALPWTLQHEFGGEGVIDKTKTEKMKKKKKKPNKNNNTKAIVIIRTNK